MTATLGILLAPGTSRVVRSAVVGIRCLPYIESAGLGDALSDELDPRPRGSR